MPPSRTWRAPDLCSGTAAAQLSRMATINRVAAIVAAAGRSAALGWLAGSCGVPGRELKALPSSDAGQQDAWGSGRLLASDCDAEVWAVGQRGLLGARTTGRRRGEEQGNNSGN